MFLFDRFYGKKTLYRIEEILLESYPNEKEITGDFFAFLGNFMDSKILDFRKTMKRYRKTNTSVNDAALAIIDGAITSIKVIQSKELLTNEEDKAVTNLILKLENIIDKSMLNSPPSFLPQNGMFAESAKGTGLDKFFTREAP